jgi:hypothetical protein
VDAVQSIEMDLDILGVQESGDGSTTVDCSATILAMTAPASGFLTDTRFVFTLVFEGSSLRIRRIEEVEPYQRVSAGPRQPVPPPFRMTWARIKSLYRTP